MLRYARSWIRPYDNKPPRHPCNTKKRVYLKPDVLIIGQGLAGSLLAWELIQRGLQVQIIDRGHQGSASAVAAGLFTPVTGKRFVLTWKAEELLARLVDFYPALERVLDVSIFHSRDTLRIFLSEEEQALWMEKRDQLTLAPYRGADFGPGERAMPVHHPWGGFELRGSGWVDLDGMVRAMRKVFLKRGILIEREVDPMELPEAERVIFCEGYRSAMNPWFKHLPFRNAHGICSPCVFPIYRASIFSAPGCSVYLSGAICFGWARRLTGTFMSRVRPRRDEMNCSNAHAG
jgi:hypothetical protein